MLTMVASSAAISWASAMKASPIHRRSTACGPDAGHPQAGPDRAHRSQQDEAGESNDGPASRSPGGRHEVKPGDEDHSEGGGSQSHDNPSRDAEPQQRLVAPSGAPQSAQPDRLDGVRGDQPKGAQDVSEKHQVMDHLESSLLLSLLTTGI